MTTPYYLTPGASQNNAFTRTSDGTHIWERPGYELPRRVHRPVKAPATAKQLAALRERV